MNDSFKQKQIISQPTELVDISALRTASGMPSRILLTVGAAGPIVFLAVATIAGLLTPGYNLLAQPVSELALGPNGWLQTINFFVFGLALIAFAFGLYRGLDRGSRVGTLLLVVAGLAMLATGVYPTDRKGAPETDAGVMHNMLFLVIIFAMMIAYIFSALALRKQAGWRGYARFTAFMPVVVFGLTFVFAAFGSDPGDPLYAVAGLIQRLLLVVAFGWVSLTAQRLLSQKAAG